MPRSSRIDATQGSLIKLILLYACPVMIKYLIQTTFSAVDMVVLGNMADSVSVAAVGATASITSLVFGIFTGFGSGIKPLVARLMGEGDGHQLRKVVDTALLLAFFGSLLSALVGFVFAPDFLRLTKCPEECFDGALIYLRIYIIAGAPFSLLFGVGSSVMDAAGEAKPALHYTFFSGILKILLNILLCLILPQKVVAVAIATAVANFIAAALTIRHLCRSKDAYRIELLNMQFDFSSCSTILWYALPVSFSSIVIPLSNLQIQTAINSYGIAAVAGNSASVTIENITNALPAGFASTAAVFVGQNLGARKNERVRKSLFHCLWLAFACAVVLGAFFYLTSEVWLSLILTDDLAAIEFAKTRMAYIVLPYFLISVASVISHCIPVYGYPILNTVNNLVCVFAFRFFWMGVIYPMEPSFSSLMLCYPVSQALIILSGSIMLLVIMRGYEKRTSQLLSA